MFTWLLFLQLTTDCTGYRYSSRCMASPLPLLAQTVLFDIFPQGFVHTGLPAFAGCTEGLDRLTG